MTQHSAGDNDDPFDDEEPLGSSERASFLHWLSKLADDRSNGMPRPDASSIGLPRSLGRFQLQTLLGTGTYGAVFRAIDRVMERKVALKIAWPAVMLDPDASRRFVEEPRTIAAIKHLGIVEVYDTGSLEMARFISLELVEGPTLGDWLKEQEQVPVRVAARIIHDVATAVQYAHDQKIVHRDLKPRNILLRPDAALGDEFPFQPVVTDFGLAHRPRLVDTSGATATFAVIGTDRYMSPEQAGGQASEAGAASDIFSLGVMLYELVAGRRPFDGDSGATIRDQIQRDDPPRIRPWRKGVPRDIETIIFKCLEKSPSRRYPSAAALAEDLRRFLAGEPIQARPVPTWERAWRYMRRKPVVVVASTLGAAALLIVAALIGALLEERRSAAREVAVAHAAAEFAEGMERQHQYVSMLRYAAKAQSQGNRGETLRYLRECEALATPPVRLGIEWHLMSAMTNDVDQVLRANLGGVRTVRFSPGGELLVSGGSDNRLIFWDTSTWKPSRSLFNAGRAVKAAEFSADGAFLAVGGENGRVVVHRMSDESIAFDQKLISGRVFDIAWFGPSHSFAVGGEDGVLWVVDPERNESRKIDRLEPSPATRAVDPEHPNEITALAYLPSRNLVAVLKAPVEIVLVDPASLSQVETWGPEFTVESASEICSVPEEKGYLAVSCAKRVALCTASDGKVVASIPITQQVEEMQYCPATKMLSACCRDGSIHLWYLPDVLAGQPEKNRRATGHGGRALTVGISADGRLLASGGRDGTVRVWNRFALGSALELPMLLAPLTVEFSPCGRWLAFSQQSEERTVRHSLIDLTSGQTRWSAAQAKATTTEKEPSPLPPGAPISFNQAGTEVILGMWTDGFEVRRCESGDVIQRFSVDDHANTAAWFSPSGQEIVVHELQRLRLMPLDSEKKTLAVTGSGKLVASFATPGGEVWLKIKPGRRIELSRTIEGSPFHSIGIDDEKRFTTAAMSRDGRYLALGGYALEVSLWDLKDNKPPFRLMGHSDWITQLRFSMDGNTLASHSADGTIKLWSLATRSELMTIGTANDRVLCFALHPHDKALALGVKRGNTFSLRLFSLGDKNSLPPIDWKGTSRE